MDNYVYLSVKLSLEEGQTEESIQEIVQEMDYSFVHADIIDHEIVDIIDTQISHHQGEGKYIDLFDSGAYSEEDYDENP